MLRNYLIIAFRFFARQRGFSIINISGLTIGVASSLLLLLYIQDELSFDNFHADSERIYRVGFEGRIQGKLTQSTLTSFSLRQELEKVEDVQSVCRLGSWQTFPVQYENKSYTEPYLLLADKNFFKFFSFKLIEGHPDSVLNGNRKVVISESAAKKYFNYKGKGDNSPLGKTLNLAQGYLVQVSGIAEDAPRNSHFRYTLILSLSSWEVSETQDWLTSKVLTYYKLKENADAKSSEAKIQLRLVSRLNQEMTHLRNTDLEKYNKQGNELKYIIQPLGKIHLHSDLLDEIEKNGNIQYIYLFASIAVFITLIACINFMNLTTARSASRAKEVAVRKAVGAQNARLIWQFLLESYFYVIIAVILSLLILVIALVPFNFFTEKDLTIASLLTPPFVWGMLLFVLLTGLVAGSYPAFYLTHFSPIDVLKGDLRARLRSYGIRNILVVFQFFISTTLIFATMVVYLQLRFMQNVDLGFNKENIINLLHTRNLGNQAIAFKNDLLKEDRIIAASYCNRLPPNIDWQSVFRPDTTSKDYLLAVYEMDYDHLKTMNYQLVSGRFFDERENDSLSLILNEAAIRKLGLQNPLGKKIFTNYDQPAGRDREIIGVVKDFNFQSLKNEIQPLAIILGFQPNWEMAIKVKTVDEETIRFIQTNFNKYAQGAPFEYSLVQQNFELKQQREKNIGLLFILFTVLAIVIACLGLFGLATFTVEQQRKAIGIRKVLGASVSHIVTLLNKGFLTLVLMANLLAWPVAWWLMSLWLRQFAYHISVPWWVFVLSGLLTFSIALISISSRAISAATGNPVNSLRNE
jgi:putative ABC transport system permease protein